MLLPHFQAYLRTFFPQLPAIHWMGIIVVSLALAAFLSIRRKYPVYGAVALGLSLLLGLFLLDALALVRCGDSPLIAHPELNLTAEYQRLVAWEEDTLYLVLFNAAVFAPFGFTLAEFLASARRLTGWRCLKYVALTAFGLSLCIEMLQLLFRVGIFELTDLVLNTAGAILGAALPVLIGFPAARRGSR